MERFIVGKEIGSGAFAKVYSGLDSHTDDKVAIKTIQSKKNLDGIDWTALREVRILSEISDKTNSIHIHIVSLLSVYSNPKDKSLNLVLEYCPLDLEKVILSKETLHEADIRSYISMTLKALNFLHSRFLLHRDLKPGNLLLGEDRLIKLADFGLAREFGFHERTMTDAVITLPYRPPELLFGAREYSGKVDLWSVGCCLAELFVREIFLPGVDEADQISKIYYIFGTEKQKVFKDLPKFEEYEECKEQPLERRFMAASKEAVQMMRELMELDPNKRLSASEALRHPFLLNGRQTDPKQLPFPV